MVFCFQLTYESVEKLKQETNTKPHNLSKIWLRNSNFISLDAYKGHRPPIELRRYFENPPIMIEYHKPYEHMKLEDIPEEQELEKINEVEPDEAKEVETEEIKEAEIEEIKEAETKEIKEAEIEVKMEQIEEVISEEIRDGEAPQQNSPENEDQQIPHKLKNQPVNTNTFYDSETTVDQFEFPNDGGEIISVAENITLDTNPEIEKKSPNIPNMEIDESNNNSEQSDHESESNFTNKQNDTPDSIDSFLLCAKKYTRPSEIVKSYNEYVTKEAVRKNLAENHNPCLEFLNEHTGINKEPQETKVKTPGSVNFHNPYLQFIEERIQIERIPETFEQRIKTPLPGKYQNQHLQIIEHPVKETEPEQIPQQMEIDKNIKTNTPQQSTDLEVAQLEERYYNLYLGSVKAAPSKISNKPLILNKPIPDSGKPTKPVLKSLKTTTENKPVKIVVTSEPLKCINSYVGFLQDLGYGSIENATKLVKVSNEIPIPPKNTIKCNLTKKSSQNMVPVTPVLEKPSIAKTIEGSISGHSYFDHQKMYRRASILKKTYLPRRTQREIELLAAKIKTRAAIIRKDFKKFQKTDLNAEKVVEEHAVAKLACNDKGQSGQIVQLQEDNSPIHLPLKSKEHLDSLLTEIPPKLPQNNKNKIVTTVEEHSVKSMHTNRVSDELKEQNQGDQDNDQITLKEQADQELRDQNVGIILEDHANNQMWSDEEDNTMDSQVDRALKVLDESLKNDIDPILRNEEDHNTTNDQNNHTVADNNDPLQLKNIRIAKEEDQLDNNLPKDQDYPSFVVHNVFTLNEQDSEHEDVIPKEHYDHIMMLANQDDQIMEDGQVAVKIESIDEDFQGSFGEEHGR